MSEDTSKKLAAALWKAAYPRDHEWEKATKPYIIVHLHEIEDDD